MQFRHQQGLTQVHLQSQWNDLQYLKLSESATVQPASQRAWEPLWQEKQLQLAGQITYDNVKDQLLLTRATATSDGVQITASGVLSDWEQYVVDLQGEVTYDLSKLGVRLESLIGTNVQLTGTSREPFTLKGPLLVKGMGNCSHSKFPLGFKRVVR